MFDDIVNAQVHNYYSKQLLIILKLNYNNSLQEVLDRSSCTINTLFHDSDSAGARTTSDAFTPFIMTTPETAVINNSIKEHVGDFHQRRKTVGY